MKPTWAMSFACSSSRRAPAPRGTHLAASLACVSAVPAQPAPRLAEPPPSRTRPCIIPFRSAPDGSFRASYQVRRCTKARAHDWTECPFTHPGEKARRRDPRRFAYCGTACPDFRKGACRRGDACEFAHGAMVFLRPSAPLIRPSALRDSRREHVYGPLSFAGASRVHGCRGLRVLAAPEPLPHAAL